MTRYSLHIILFCFTPILVSQTYDQLIQEKKYLKEESESLTKTLEANQITQQHTLEALKIINTKIEIQNNTLKNIELEIQFLQDNINDLELDLIELIDELKFLKINYAKLINQTYFVSRNYNRLLFFLSSENFNQLIRRFYYFREIERDRRKKFQIIEGLRLEIHAKKEILIVKKGEQTDLLFSKKNEIQKLGIIQNTKHKTISFLQTKEDSLFDLILKKKEQAKKISNEIVILLKKEKEGENKLTPELKLISTNFAKNKGRLPWPTTQGAIISKFGTTPHPVLSGISTINNGIEIATNTNQVRTIFNGKVAKIIILPNGLKGVIIGHGEYFTVYSNLVNISVQNGDRVDTKSIIGTLYNEETQQRNILELQIWKFREKLNPEEWLSSY